MLICATQRKPNRVTNDQARSNAAYPGNSMPEYALVGILLVVVCLLALQNLSGGVNSAMARSNANMQAHKQQATDAQAVHQAMATASATGAVTGLTAAQQALLEESMSQKLQTSGANGATEVLADQIAAAASLLLSEGKIDQNQYNILMQLSNQGHKMAQIESMINDAVNASNGNFGTFQNMSFTSNGQTYNALQMSLLIGFAGPAPSDFASTNILAPDSATQKSAEPEVAAFMNLYNQAMASGALSDPLAQSTVTSASTQIASIGEVVENGIFLYEIGAIKTPSQIAAANASDATNMNSAAICTAGNFQDNGALCKP